MSTKLPRVCEAAVALVLQTESGLRAVIGQMSVKASPRPATATPQDLLTFGGGVQLAESTIDHLRNVVAPQVMDILDGLSFPPMVFELSVAPLSAASGQGQDLAVEGHSGDLIAALGMFGAAGGPRVPSGVLVTGHVGPGGTVRMVEYMDEKFTAVPTDPRIHTVICPSLTADSSLPLLTPDYVERIQAARAALPPDIKVLPVATLAEAFAAAFDDRSMVLESLRCDFHQPEGRGTSRESGDCVAQVVALCREGNAERFWAALEADLMAQDHAGVTESLEAYLSYHTRRGIYPESCGGQLQELFWSTPGPYLLALPSPLVDYANTLDLARLAVTPEEQTDALLLIELLQGRHTAFAPSSAPSTPANSKPTDADADARVAWTIDEISASHLEELIGKPLALASATFVLKTFQPDSHEAFWQEAARFWVHLGRRSGMKRLWRDSRLNASEAAEAFSEAYAQQGGENTAEAIARSGLHGGFPAVLAQVTAWVKQDLCSRHVSRVLKEAMDPLSTPQQISYLRAFLARLGDQLPPDVRMMSPESLLDRKEILVRRYVQAVDRLVDTFRGL